VKKLHVADLKDGDAVTLQLLVREKEIRTSPRTGKSWLELSLADRTGSIPAKMWDNFEPILKTFHRDDVVLVRARVKLYNNQKELTLEQIVPASDRDYDIADFLPHTHFDVEKLYSELRGATATMKNPWLQRLVTSIVDDPILAAKIKSAPAAMTMHHAYLGGLLEHLVSLIGLSRAVAGHFPELDPDLLLTGILLHDIGKTDELRYARAIDYSTEGRLLGHIAIGLILTREKIRSIPGFPEPLARLVEHLILSHHGSHEFGSPALPQFPEAVVLHFLDDVDSKMASMRETLRSSDPTSEWSDRNPSLRRALLRTDAILKATK
jgi:3'-5' exoribonuclease